MAFQVGLTGLAKPGATELRETIALKKMMLQLMKIGTDLAKALGEEIGRGIVAFTLAYWSLALPGAAGLFAEAASILSDLVDFINESEATSLLEVELGVTEMTLEESQLAEKVERLLEEPAAGEQAVREIQKRIDELPAHAEKRASEEIARLRKDPMYTGASKEAKKAMELDVKKKWLDWQRETSKSFEKARDAAAKFQRTASKAAGKSSKVMGSALRGLGKATKAGGVILDVLNLITTNIKTQSLSDLIDIHKKAIAKIAESTGNFHEIKLVGASAFDIIQWGAYMPGKYPKSTEEITREIESMKRQMDAIDKAWMDP